MLTRWLRSVTPNWLSVAAQRVSGGLKDELWLVPIEDRRERGALREGMRSGLSLGQYLMLVEPTSSNQA